MPKATGGCVACGYEQAIADNGRLRRELAKLIAASDTVVYRPAVDDSRKIDRDTLNLREVTNAVRVALNVWLDRRAAMSDPYVGPITDTDLVELRQHGWSVAYRAADEIDRLRREVKESQERAIERKNDDAATIDRLRRELKEALRRAARAEALMYRMISWVPSAAVAINEDYAGYCADIRIDAFLAKQGEKS
jgi:hypothetical protein